MIRRIVDFALDQRLLVVVFTLLLIAAGMVAFHRLPVDAYPDVADNYVEVITQWPGISAEQVEQQVTVPLENALNGIPHTVHLRSFSIFGLSDIKLIFDDESSDDWNRERVLERLSQVTLPTGVTPQMGTDWSPVGQIYFFTLHSTNPQYDVMELKSIEDWVVEKNLKAVPDIVDVNTFGGPTREYQVRVDPNKLISYGLSLAQVEQQLTNNNVNAGGSFVEAGLQQINVREVGLVRNVHDIENTVIQVYGDDLQILEDTANEVAGLMRQVKGIEDLGVFCVLGQPNLNVTVDRQQAVRYQINVADVQDAIQTAVGGNALTQVLLGEARYDLVLRYLPQYRDKEEAIQNIRLLSPGGERVSLAQLCRIEERDGASEIYREGNQRYIAIKYSVRGRDLGSAVEEAITKVKEKVKLPTGYHIEHNNVTSGLRARPGERR